ncbi:hypothetical protein C0989_002204 [Termitomyces sp. Mn162]|nr:hypothetical protein C0989_002204 [Termitomyces sp. Mn162]
MSPPSYSAASPAPLISDADMVIVYDSKEEEFEHWHRAELSTVVVGSPGGPRQAKFCPAVPRLAAGDAEEVPPLQQIPQEEVTVEEFARALAWARGPPMLEWCQNEAPCVLCTWRGEACVFDAPSVGSQRDTSICLPCCASHKKCSISFECQLGKARKTRMLEEVSMGQSVGQVGPPQGGWREGASSAADRGKQRASPPSGAGPSKRPWEYEAMADPPGFHVHSPTLDAALGRASSSLEPPPLITEVFLRKQVEVLTAALTAWEEELQ